MSVFQCPYNEECSCDPSRRFCERCGWNPAVAKARLERICKKLGIQEPEPREPEVKEETES